MALDYSDELGSMTKKDKEVFIGLNNIEINNDTVSEFLKSLDLKYPIEVTLSTEEQDICYHQERHIILYRWILFMIRERSLYGGSGHSKKFIRSNRILSQKFIDLFDIKI